jgi:hypothetical protein
MHNRILLYIYQYLTINLILLFNKILKYIIE